MANVVDVLDYSNELLMITFVFTRSSEEDGVDSTKCGKTVATMANRLFSRENVRVEQTVAEFLMFTFLSCLRFDHQSKLIFCINRLMRSFSFSTS